MKSLSLVLLSSSFLSTLALGAPMASEKKAGKTIRVPSTDPWDYDVHTGAGFGTFTNKDEIKKAFGGVLAGISLYNEKIFDSQTALLKADVLIDGGTQQIIRKRLAVGTDWPLLGGKKRTIERFKAGTAVSQSNFNLSWSNTLAYDLFTITPNAVGIENLQGSHLGWSTGIGLQWVYGEDASLGLKVEQTLMSFASSIEKSKSASTDLIISLRNYL